MGYSSRQLTHEILQLVGDPRREIHELLSQAANRVNQ